jgi:4a-hydroxytetrahydrobiopterin dehydratase
MPRLSAVAIEKQMRDLRGWRRRGRTITRTFIFKTFLGGITFVEKVARLAERANHHPDITIRYNRIRLDLTTHDYGGLTMRDFTLARRINRLVERH